MTNNSKKFTIVQFLMVYNQFIFIKNKLVSVKITLQGIFQLFHACDSGMLEAALFQNIFKVCTFLPKFSNILPFFGLILALFLKNPYTLHYTRFIIIIFFFLFPLKYIRNLNYYLHLYNFITLYLDFILLLIL